MGEKIFGEIQTTEDLNELARNLRKTKEFDEIRLLCQENGISAEDAEDFIKGNRVLLTENGQQENAGEDISAEASSESALYDDCVPMGTCSLVDTVKGIPKPTDEEIKAAEDLAKSSPEYTVEHVRKKLEQELKIYRDGDSKYVIEKLIELCNTDKDLLGAIMLPHKSYDKAFQYFYEKSRNVGYKMPYGNMVYLDNDKAVELSVEYFKRDDVAEEKKKAQRKNAKKQQAKENPETSPKANVKSEEKKAASKAFTGKPLMKKEQEKSKQEAKQKKKDMDGQMSLFDF